jgi:GAF domain-containing protein
MTAVSEDASIDLKRRIAELERRLDAALIERDTAIDQRTASALVNFRLQSEARAGTDRQSAAAEILRTIASAPGDAPRVLQQIAETSARLFGAPSASIQLAENGEWTQAYRFGDSSTRVRAAVPLDTIRVGGPNLPGTVVAENRQIHLPDLDHLDPAFAHWPGPPHARAAGARTMCGTPLRREDKAIGVLIIYRDQLAPFTAEELALLQSFADQGAIAIENARLFNETREALERQTATADILKVLASSPSDVQPVFEAIVRSAARLFEPCAATITTVKDGKLHWDATAALLPGYDVEGTKTIYPIPFDPVRVPSARAILERRIIEIPDTGAPDIPEFARRAAAAGGYRAITYVPLIDQDQGIGTIIFAHPQPGFKFSEKQLALVGTFADQAVIAIQNARLFNETKEALARQTATSDMLRVISRSPTDVQPVFDAIVLTAARLLGCDRGTILRTDGTTFSAVAAANRDGPIEALSPPNQPIDPVANFPSQAIVARKMLYVPDWTTIELPEHEHVIRDMLNINSALYLPLLRGDDCIGLLVLVASRPNQFGPAEIELAESFRDQALIAIENARLFNETREALERQTATAEILKVIASSPSDVQPVFDAIATSAKRLLGAFSTAVFRLVDSTVQLGSFTPTHPAADAALQADFPMPVERFEPFRMVQPHEPLPIADTEELPHSPMRDIARLHGFRSMLYVPLMNGGVPTGLIAVTRAEPGAFAPHHVQLLQTFADQAVIAIENTRLFNETKEALERQTATADILKVIASSPSDVQPVFEAIAESAKHLLGGFSSTVFRFIDGMAHLKAFTPTTPEADQVLTASFPQPVAAVTPFQMTDAGEVVQIPDTEAETYQLRDVARARGYRSMLFVPLTNKGASIGFIAVTRVQTGNFVDHHVQLLKTFADQAVIAIENARLFNEVQAKTADLEEALGQQTATAEVLKVISRSAFDLESVMNTLTRSAASLCGARLGSIHLREGDQLVVKGFSVADENATAYIRENPIPVNEESYSGRAVLTGAIANIGDVTQDTTSPILRRMSGVLDYRALLLVPLMREGRGVGLFSLTRDEAGAFSPREVELVQTFADQAVIAIENVRLFNEVQARTADLQESLQQQTATADVLKVISRSVFDLQTVLDTLVESAYQLCGARLGLLYLKGEEAFECKAIAGRGSEEASRQFKGRPIRAGRGTAAERVILTGEVHCVEDLLEDPEVDPAVKDMIRNAGADAAIGAARSTLAVPMTRDNAVIGVLVIVREETGPFPARQVEILQTFADQAVIAIENARLFDEVQARTRELTEALTYQTGSSNILKIIASSPTDVGPVFKAIVESACELCESYDAILRLREGDSLSFGAHHGPLSTVGDMREVNRHWTAGRAVIDRTPIHVTDMTSAEGDEFPEAQKRARSAGQRTILSVPLLREGESIGVITLRRTEVHPFTDKQIALLQTFADQAVIAIGNVNLFEEVQARTRELSESLQFQTASAEVLKVISRSPDNLQPVLDVIVDTSRELCNALTSVIFLLRDGKFHHAAESVDESFSRPDYINTLRGNPISPDQVGSALARATREKRTIHIPNSAEDPEAGLGGPMDLGGAKALLSVPLILDGSVIGGITLRQSHLSPFTPRQIEAIESFADQAVIAISNVNLFEQVQERTRELSKSLDDLRAAQDRLVQTEKLASLGQLTAGIAHEIKNPLNFVNNFASLSAELTDELKDALRPAVLDETIRAEVNEITGLLKDNLGKVVQHGKRADSIVRNMLLHSREGSGEHRPTDVNALVDESLNLAYHGARAEKPQFNVTLTRDFDPEAGMIEAFPQEITRVLLNLITNGFYAVTKRKTDQKTDQGDASFEPVVSATTKGRSDHVEIRIRDNGTGIPSEVKEKMFNPFFTTKPAGEGTGLGLSMSHDIIVKQHGGTIDVDTVPGEFTEFTVVLPRHKT